MRGYLSPYSEVEPDVSFFAVVISSWSATHNDRPLLALPTPKGSIKFPTFNPNWLVKCQVIPIKSPSLGLDPHWNTVSMEENHGKPPGDANEAHGLGL